MLWHGDLLLRHPVERDRKNNTAACELVPRNGTEGLRRERCLVASAAGENGARRPVRAEIIDAVDGEQVGKPGAGAVDAALDGADRATANSRGVLVGEARGADQDQGLA